MHLCWTVINGCNTLIIPSLFTCCALHNIIEVVYTQLTTKEAIVQTTITVITLFWWTLRYMGLRSDCSRWSSFKCLPTVSLLANKYLWLTRNCARHDYTVIYNKDLSTYLFFRESILYQPPVTSSFVFNLVKVMPGSNWIQRFVYNWIQYGVSLLRQNQNAHIFVGLIITQMNKWYKREDCFKSRNKSMVDGSAAIIV